MTTPHRIYHYRSCCLRVWLCLFAAIAFASAPIAHAQDEAEESPPAIFAQQADTLSVPGALLSYRVMGEGPTVLFISGGGGTGMNDLLSIAREVAAYGFRSVIYDQRGRGASIASPLDSTNIGVAISVRDIDALRERLGEEELALVGHSWGAQLATAYAAEHPERVDRMALLGPGPLSMDSTFWQAYVQRWQDRLPDEVKTKIERLDESSGDRLTALQMLKRYRLAIGAVIARPADPRERELFALYAESNPKNLQEWELIMQDLMGGFDVRDQMRFLSAPVLVVQGEEDALGDANAEEVAALFPQGQLVIIPGASHFIWWDKRDALMGELARFLRAEK